MDEVAEALEKYQGLVPLVYDVETMGLAEARPQDMQYAVYLKREADKVIADLEESHKMEVEQLLMEIVKLKDAQRWRKVSEEKPQDGQVVWAYEAKNDRVLLLEYEKSDEGEGFICFPYIHDFYTSITHWMPHNKPKAPEEK